MNRQRALERIHEVVDSNQGTQAHDYQTPTSHLPRRVAAALEEIGAGLAGGVDPAALVRRVWALHEDEVLDRVQLYSALGVVAASPRVRDYPEAMRLAGLQELAAWERGGDDLTANLASVERHRGVVAYLMGRHEVALECFTRALEHERSAENLANVLATLLKLGDHDEATDLLDAVRSSFPDEIRNALAEQIRTDADLTQLRARAATRPHR